MAELVDALASGASERKLVEVQVLLSAPRKNPVLVTGFFVGLTMVLHPSYWHYER